MANHKPDAESRSASAHARAEAARDRAAHETIRRLQRDMLRLVISFRGSDRELDEHLKHLGAKIRGGCEGQELQALIDEVVRIIIARDLAHNAEQRTAQSLADLLGHLPAPAAHGAEIEGLKKRLAKPLDRGSLDHLVQEAAAVLGALIGNREHDAARAAGEPGAGAREDEALSVFLHKLKVPIALDDDIAELRKRIAQQHGRLSVLQYAEEAAEILSGMLTNQVASTAHKPQVLSMREQLLSLIERLPFPGDLLGHAGRIKHSVEIAGNPKDLEACVMATANLVAEMKSRLQAEIDELASFLKNITIRLQKVEASLQQSTSSHDESIQNVNKLSRTMQEKIYDIRGEMGAQDELDKLKATINAHLDIIDDDLSKFAVEESRRHTQARDDAEGTVRKLRELEAQTERLRNDLEHQRARVLIDPLTGTFNRAGYDKHVAKEFARWMRYGGNLSLAVIDLDFFKRINDTYGHAAGDNVLATLGSLLNERIRECDILCRYGGEEFTLLLPETNLHAALVLVNKLRECARECNFHFKEHPVPVTLSCGVAEFRDGDTPEIIFERADRAMYLAKELGRDRACSEQDLPARVI